MHAALELALGAALIALPFALGLGSAAVILGIALGGSLCGVALMGAEASTHGGLPLSLHAAYDVALTVALLVAALVLGVAEGMRPLILFLAVGAAELTLAATTRYSASRA